ncbi:MAG: DUF6514 family protein [Clostridia bacterium]|jgi:hypothetical protein
MSTYTLKRRSRVIDEKKHILNIEYFLIEEFTIRNPEKTYGIKVDTKENGQITDSCSVNDVTKKKKKLYIYLKKWQITMLLPLLQKMLLKI